MLEAMYPLHAAQHLAFSPLVPQWGEAYLLTLVGQRVLQWGLGQRSLLLPLLPWLSVDQLFSMGDD